MIEKTVLDYLNEHSSVDWFMERPKNAPDKYGIIEKTGSSCSNFIYRSTFALQSYAPTLYEAAELNEETKVLMDAIIVLDQIARSDLNSDYNFTNTANKQYRYQAVYDLIHYGG